MDIKINNHPYIPDLLVSTDGKIFSIIDNHKNQREFPYRLKKRIDRYVLTISRDCIRYSRPVHRLVAETFIDNTKHSYLCGCQTQRHEKNNQSKLKLSDIVKIKELINNGLSQTKIAKIFNVTQSNISCIVRGVTWV